MSRAAASRKTRALPDSGFPPIAGADARRLILGSLPSRRSLELGQYYAHQRNAFWPIMAEICGASGGYAERCAALVKARVAVWDVLASSIRPGSLDADIRTDTAIANDFGRFLAEHPDVDGIFFNGRKAEALFHRLVPKEDMPARDIAMQCLPSTSPAHASLSFDRKLEAWRGILDGRRRVSAHEEDRR